MLITEAVWASLNRYPAVIQQVGAVGGCECDALASCGMQCCLHSGDVVSKQHMVTKTLPALQMLHVALEVLHPALVALHSALYGPAKRQICHGPLQRGRFSTSGPWLQWGLYQH